MVVFVVGVSALAHYRNTSAAVGEHAQISQPVTLRNAASHVTELEGINLHSLGIGDPDDDNPLHVLVPQANRRSGSRSVVSHVWSGNVPKGAFRKVKHDVCVASPEFLFLQMAQELELPQLVELGMELCGTYRREVRIGSTGMLNDSPETEYDIPPLTTPAKLKKFVESVGPARGAKAARQALKYVLPDSASPMETVVYLLLCLPRRCGGYGLPKPVLNPVITLSKAGRKHTLRKSSAPDLFWPKAKLDVEYNSDEHHGERQRALDSMRRKALERMNIEVIELTREEVWSTELFHATALRIARRLGKKIRPVSEGSFDSKRRALRLSLLSSDRIAKKSNADRQAQLRDSSYMSDEDVLYDTGLSGDIADSWADLDVPASDMSEERFGVDWDDAELSWYGMQSDW